MQVIHWIDSIIIYEYFIFIGNAIQKYETTFFQLLFLFISTLFGIIIAIRICFFGPVCFYPNHYF